MPLHLDISRIFSKFVGKERLYDDLTTKMFNDKKRQDYGNIYVFLHVVICHLPHHLHGHSTCREGGGEVVGITASCFSLKRAIAWLVQWLTVW